MPRPFSLHPLAFSLLFSLTAHAAPPADTQPASPLTPPPLPQRTPKSDQGVSQLPNDQLDWLLDAKLGMFIHWGLYSGPAKGEWLMENQGIKPDDYRKLASPDSGDQYFDASAYNPNDWAQLANDAGMKWICLTTRHHDGFSLFDNPHPNAFTSVQTLHRDLIADYVKACRSHNLKVGIYYSPLSWRYPGYYDVTGTHCAPNKFGYKTDPAQKENARLMKEENYVAVKTLLTHYGTIDHIFWDGGWLAQKGSDADGAFFHEPGQFLDPANQWPVSKQYWDLDPATGKPLGIMGMVRKYQPNAITNLRYGWIGDIIEEEGPAETKGPIRSDVICDKNFTIQKGPWGYSQDCTDHNKIYSRDELIRYLANASVRNMTTLINVAPDRHGTIPDVQQKPLRELGQWLKKTGPAFYNTRGGPWQPTDHLYGYTFSGNTIYIHLLKDYKGDSFVMPPMGSWVPTEVRDLYTNTPLPFTGGNNHPLTISNLDRTSSPADTIIAVTYSHPIGDIWK